jgi:DNA-binding IclR family transcriptional regulator
MVKSAERVLDILEFLRQSGPSTFSQISAALDLPKSSTSMLLHSLVSKGYLALDPRAHLYRPTYRVALLGEGISSRAVLDNHALSDALNELHKNTGMTIVVGLRNGAYVQYVHVLSGSQSLLRRLPVGKQRPLSYNPLGKVLLAQCGDDEVRLVIRHNNAARNESLPIVPEAQLFQQVTAIRDRGYALDAGFSWPNAMIAALAIHPIADLPPLSVAAGGLKEDFEQRGDQIVDELVRTMAPWRK